MGDQTFETALCIGYERLSAWSDLLDRINVFPVADSDTGKNLRISLASLRWPTEDPHRRIRNLMASAKGNSGNIAAAFLTEVLKSENLRDLGRAVHGGRLQAWRSIGNPQPGTMLSVFDALCRILPASDWEGTGPGIPEIILCLEQSVAETAEILPAVKEAGVIDAGALGMFLFLEAFFISLLAPSLRMRPVTEIFPDKLALSDGWKPDGCVGVRCIDAAIASRFSPEAIRDRLADCAESMVLFGDGERLKVHFHASDGGSVRGRLESVGEVLAWSEEAIASFDRGKPEEEPPVHIMTDAAGSVAPEDAKAYGITLLDSYLVVGGEAWPETCYEPARLYAAMAGGAAVSTAQASAFERHQRYLHVTRRYRKVFYLCVGAAYTGNYAAALAWKAEHDPADRLSVVDTGAASGRLGVVAIATARFARLHKDPEKIVKFAHMAITESDELVFLDQLKFLAAGGRVSRTKGFLGDLLHLKPVITPTRDGAVRVGVTRNRDEQLAFLSDRLRERFGKGDSPLILVQFSDNRAWVEDTAGKRIASLLPNAEILMRPLSLTSGAHMGPGTWAVAFLRNASMKGG